MTGHLSMAAVRETAALRSGFKPREISLTATLTATGSKTGRFGVGHTCSPETRAKISASETGKQPPRRTMADRIAEKVDPDGHWTAGVTKAGYPHIGEGGRRGRMIYVHRWVWEQANGPIPPGMVVMHVDDEPRNANLANLRLGTHQDNSDDKIAKGRHRNAYTGRIGAS